MKSGIITEIIRCSRYDLAEVILQEMQPRQGSYLRSDRLYGDTISGALWSQVVEMRRRNASSFNGSDVDGNRAGLEARRPR